MLEVCLLGKFTIEVDGRQVELPLRAAQSLLAYLMLTAGTAHRREHLAGSLWPDTLEANAKGNLRHTLWRLRRALGGRGFILADELTVTFDASAEYWLDAQVVARKAEANVPADELMRMVSAYGGELLPGFYDDWIVLERERLQAAFERKMALLMDRLVEGQRWDDVLEWGERWIALGHTPEPAYRALMLAYAGLGDLAKVASAFRRCAEALHHDLGVEPSEQTRALYERLTHGEHVPGPTPSAPEPRFETRYRLDAEIGRGGMAVVYRGHDTLLDRPVALKVLNISGLGTQGRARLLREAQATARLNHPNIVSIYDVGEKEGTPCIVMELVEGELLNARRPAAFDEVLTVARQICAALEHAHRHGILHRDLKPQNIIIALTPAPLPEREREEGVRVKLMDFGLARSVDTPRLTEEGALVGTFAYLAPEVIQGQPASAQSDLYALGVMLYELTTGRLPFEGDNAATVLSHHLHATVIPPSTHNPAILPALEALIIQLLSKRPDDRPASAGDVRRALEQVAEARGASSPVEAVSNLDRLVRGRLVAREREFADAAAHWQEAASGHGHVLLVSGEPGIGKTRLMRELTTHVELAGGKALVGECYAEGGAPYAPIAQILQSSSLQSLIPDLPPLVLADLLTLAPALRARFPDTPPNPPLDPQAEQQRMFESVVEFFTALTARVPILLAVDDAHWADGGTLTLLRHLARRAVRARSTAPLRLLIVVTYREVELAEARALNDVLADLNRERLATRLKLSRLTRDQTRDLLAAMFAEEITPEFLDGLYRETEGNPFFVEEVCKALIEEGKLYRENGRWRRPAMSEIRVPQSVRVAVEARVGRLPEGIRETLRLAAVLGREFDFDTLQKAGDLDEDALVSAVEMAEKAQLLGEVRRAGWERYAFAHALIPAALRESVSGARRRRLHRRAATAIESLHPDDYEALAHHYGEAGDEERARTYYARAADRARKLYANDDAIRFYSEVLALTPEDHPERFDLLAARAKVYDIVARREAQRADIDAMLALAEKQNDDARRCDALIALTDFHLATDYTLAQEPAEHAVRIAGRMGDVLREGHALRRLSECAFNQGDLLQSRAVLEQAVTRFRGMDLASETATCLHMLAISLQRLGNLSTAEKMVKEAIDVSRMAGDRLQEAAGLRRLGVIYVTQGRWAEDLSVTQMALALHRELGDRVGEGRSLHNLGGTLAFLGKHEESEGNLRQALAIGEAINSTQIVNDATDFLMGLHFERKGEYEAGLAFLEAQLAKAQIGNNQFLVAKVNWFKADVLGILGHFGSGMELIQPALATGQFGSAEFQSDALWLRGRLWAECGDYAQARRDLQAALEQGEKTGHPFAAVWPRLMLAYTAWLEGRAIDGQAVSLPVFRAGLDHAQHVIALLTKAPLYWHVELTFAFMIAARLHLALSETDEALTHSTEAIRLMSTLPSPSWPEKLFFTHAQVLRTVGRAAEAEEYLRKAYERVMLVASKTKDETLRRGWLENVRDNREIVREFESLKH